MKRSENDLKEKLPFDSDSLRDISDKVDVEKVLTSDNLKNLNYEKSTHLGYEDKDLLYEYSYDDLGLSSKYEDLINHLNDSNVEKVIISGELPAEKIVSIVKAAEEKGLDFTILTNPEFTGKLALGLVKKRNHH